MRVLILGGGPKVFLDAARALSMFEPDMVVAVNEVGAEWSGRLDHWVSLHPEIFPDLLRRRRANGLKVECRIWSYYRIEEQLDPPLEFEDDYDPSGLGGLYAIRVGKRHGGTRFVLAGVPMDRSGNAFDGGDRRHWINLRRRDAWRQRHGELASCVRSTSGWTREMFGEPTRDWLATINTKELTA